MPLTIKRIIQDVPVEITLTNDELILAYFEAMKLQQEAEGDYRQWIADVYHCSECWGQTMTDEEMLIDLAESRRQADPDDYVPDITLHKECAAYWNELCARHPC